MPVKKGSILLKKVSVRYKIGDKFGLLEIIGERQVANKRAKYLCRCECGKEHLVGEQELKHGQKSCVKCKILVKNPHSLVIGKRFRSWDVIEYVGEHIRSNTTDKKHKTDKLYRCKCYKCGLTRDFRGNILRAATLPNCSKCEQDNWLSNKAWGRILVLVKLSAKKRNIEVSIDEAFIEQLYYKQNSKCALSGLDITIPKSNKEMMAYIWTASLDRIDSTIGYIESNCQFVHKAINQMKMALPQESFIEYCKHIASNTTIKYEASISEGFLY